MRTRKKPDSKPNKASRANPGPGFQNVLDGTCDIHFRQVIGKVIDSVRYTSESAGGSLVIDFTDQTALIVDCHPELRYTMEADYSDWKTGEARATKRWKRVSSWE